MKGGLELCNIEMFQFHLSNFFLMFISHRDGANDNILYAEIIVKHKALKCNH